MYRVWLAVAHNSSKKLLQTQKKCWVEVKMKIRANLSSSQYLANAQTLIKLWTNQPLENARKLIRLIPEGNINFSRDLGQNVQITASLSTDMSLVKSYKNQYKFWYIYTSWIFTLRSTHTWRVSEVIQYSKHLILCKCWGVAISRKF